MDSLFIPTLETERLRLRPLRGSDVDDYADLHADPEVMHHVGGTWDRNRSWRHLCYVLGHWQIRGAGLWAVEHQETRAFVGLAGFFEPEGWPGFELCGKLARRFWGCGYASEAARAALDHAFAVWKKDRVISLVRPENRASVRLVERIGERLLARIEHQGREMLCYGVDREAWAVCSRAPKRLRAGSGTAA